MSLPDAMSLIDSNSNELALLMNGSQHFPERLLSKKFRRNVEKACIRMPAFKVIFNPSTLDYGRAA